MHVFPLFSFWGPFKKIFKCFIITFIQGMRKDWDLLPSQAARTIFRTDVISTCHFSLFPPHFPHISPHCRYCEVFVKEVEKHHAAMQAFILADKDTTERHWHAYGTICIYNSIDIASLFYSHHKNLSILFKNLRLLENWGKLTF